MRPDDVGELTLGLVVIAEDAVDVLAYVGGENTVGAVVQNDIVLMIGDSLAVRLNPRRDYMYVVVPRVMVGVDEIRLSAVADALHQLTGEVRQFLR